MRGFRPRGPGATSGNLGPGVPQDSQRIVLFMEDRRVPGRLEFNVIMHQMCATCQRYVLGKGAGKEST